MPHYTYIIYSTTQDRYYIGESADPISRCDKHNRPHRGWTSGKGPWELRYVEAHPDRKAAMLRERFFKAQKSSAFLKKLIESDPFDGRLPDI